MKTETKTGKLATARQISGNLYDVTYPYTVDLDKAVPYEYLRRLTRKGYTVTCHDEDGTHVVATN
jgi:hypothetical protein